MPLAIQYGMPLDEFWHGDMRLLEVYQKAYMRDVSYKCWLQGQYNFMAFGITMANSFAKKGAKPKEYPEWKDPFEGIKERVTAENLEKKQRDLQKNQNNFIRSLLNKK